MRKAGPLAASLSSWPEFFSTQKLLADGVSNTFYAYAYVYIYVNLCVYIIVYICVYIYIDNIYIDTYIVC